MQKRWQGYIELKKTSFPTPYPAMAYYVLWGELLSHCPNASYGPESSRRVSELLGKIAANFGTKEVEYSDESTLVPVLNDVVNTVNVSQRSEGELQVRESKPEGRR